MSDFLVRSADVRVGVPPKEFQDCHFFMVHFYGFGSLDSTKGHCVKSPIFECFNHEWLVKLYPGGDKKAKDGMMSIFLQHVTGNEVSVDYVAVARNGSGEIVGRKRSHDSSDTYTKGHQMWGYSNFIKRSVALENLYHGALMLEIQMKLDIAKSRANFVPKNPFSYHMLKLLLDEESSDVLFEVSSDGDSSKMQISAHRLFLKAGAPDLACLCEGCDKSSPVPITDVEPQVFKQILWYVYGGKVLADWEKDAKKIIDAADKYGIVDLKVEAEGWYVTRNTFTVDNVIDELLYADAKSCPLLREAAMDFILKNAKKVIKSDPFKSVLKTETISKEIMLALAADDEEDKDESESHQQSINDLRMSLHELGLEVDGSREMLESRLKE